jgi:hypothetical protein
MRAPIVRENDAIAHKSACRRIPCRGNSGGHEKPARIAGVADPDLRERLFPASQKAGLLTADAHHYIGFGFPSPPPRGSGGSGWQFSKRKRPIAGACATGVPPEAIPTGPAP